MLRWFGFGVCLLLREFGWFLNCFVGCGFRLIKFSIVVILCGFGALIGGCLALRLWWTIVTFLGLFDSM